MSNRHRFFRKALIISLLYSASICSVYANGDSWSNSLDQTSDQQLQLTAVHEPNNMGSAYQQQDNTQYDPNRLFQKPTSLEEQAFNNVARKAMPMTPEQIMRFKQMMSVTQRAAAASEVTPPKPTLSTQRVSLAPGAIPPVVRLQEGFVTSVVFVDSTGANWPIVAYDLGNSRAFNIQWESHSNTLMIQATSKYTYGNLAVQLKGLSTPVMLTLLPGQKVVDYRVDLRVQGDGPNAKPVTVTGEPPAASEMLLAILNNIPPSNGETLKVTGGECQAWKAFGKMYLRTRLTVLSPGWIAMMSSPDGTNAYEMAVTSSVLVSKYGKPVELKIES